MAKGVELKFFTPKGYQLTERYAGATREVSERLLKALSNAVVAIVLSFWFPFDLFGVDLK